MRLVRLLLCAGLIISSPSFAADFTMNSEAFLNAGALPVLYTCDGKDISPQITWSNPPPKTQSFAIVMSDPDAPSGTFYHWLEYNISNTTKELPEGPEKVSGALMGKNSFGKVGYNGPCPPKGAAHTYNITLYALDNKLTLPAGADYKALEEAIKSHIVGTAKLTAVYSRWTI